jgi:geranylgeranyl transferase type-2 subunit beta
MSFLAILRDDVRSGLAAAPAEYRDKHSKWIRAKQLPDGGFENRRGKSDLYYTTFALRSLSALNTLDKESAQKSFSYLMGQFRQPDTVRTRQPRGAFSDAVMAASWWDALTLCEEAGAEHIADADAETARQVTVARLSALRRDDGGWAKTDTDACGSLYHTFLTACAYFRMNLELPQADRAKTFLMSLIQPAGGFLENKYSKRPGTNGCAAAIALSAILDATIDPEPHATLIAGMFSGEGGFYAAPSAPIADLLSTYTALFTLKMLGKLESRYVNGALRYARSLEDANNGGYAGFALEQVLDCEYTFYGLGVESIGCGAIG